MFIRNTHGPYENHAKNSFKCVAVLIDHYNNNNEENKTSYRMLHITYSRVQTGISKQMCNDPYYYLFIFFFPMFMNVFLVRFLTMPTECAANPLQRALADSIVLMKPLDEIRILLACGAKVRVIVHFIQISYNSQKYVVNREVIDGMEQTI